ncbi:Colicin I receptor [Thalassocella blandensis]|nr:Colicin I receptor [Thalassocella blandensis]
MNTRSQPFKVNLKTASLALAIGALTSIQAQAEATIRGRLTNASGNLGIEGALISIQEVNLQTTTNRDGRYSFPGLRQGDYTMVIEYIGSTTQTRKITVSDEQDVIQLIALDEENHPMEETLVIGQAASLNKALNKQRAADSIVSIVNADAIGQYPDANTSEALQRLPGVSVENDQGEGRFVRVRGLGPNFNSVTINGSKVPSPNSGERAVALDVVPSDLLESLEVTKTLTPDMDADSLGGTINVKSLSAFDRDGFFYKANIETNYDEHTSQYSPKISLTSSQMFSLGKNENIGIAGAVSWYERDFGSDNVETGGSWNFEDPVILEEFEQREYNITRKRVGATLNFDWQATDHTSFYLRTLYSEYSDAEVRLANGYALFRSELNEEGELENVEGIAANDSGEAEITREIKDRKETQKIRSFVLGGTSEWRSWTLNYRLGLGKSSEDTPLFIDSAAFTGEFDDGVSFSGTRIIQAQLPPAALETQNYVLDEVETASQITEDTENNIKWDAEKRLTISTLPISIKFGAKISQREKTSDEQVWVYEDFDEQGFGPEQLLLSHYSDGHIQYQYGNMGAAIQSSKIWQALSPLDQQAFIAEADSIVADFELHEDISAAYLMGTVDINQLRLLAGVRYEGTEINASGMGYDEYEVEDATIVEISPREFEKTYHHTLPSLHARLKINNKTQVRAAWTNAVVRPTFEQISPGKIREDDEVEFGNPNLKPLEASNIDIGIEYYSDFASYFSAFVFTKDIDNFIYAIDLGSAADPILVGPGEFSEANTFKNGDSATLTGLELAASKKFSELPAPWNGLLVAANGTWTDSEASIEYREDDTFFTREITMPSQSDFSGNISVGYENDMFSFRIAANYKSEYLLEVTEADNAMGDVWVDEQLSFDVLTRWNISKHIQAYLQAVNLGDEPYYTYIGKKHYNNQYEDYGPSYRIGFNFGHF